VNSRSAPSRGGVQGWRVVRGGALALLVLFVASATGCATKRDLRDLRAEIRAQTAHQDTTLVTIQELIHEVENAVLAQSAQDFDARAELMRQLLNLEEQMIQVQELSGQNQRTLAQLRDQVESRRDQLREPIGTPGGRPVLDLGQADEDYDAALEAYNRSSMAAARRGFEAFVQRYPSHRRTPDAHYYLALVLEQVGDENAALAELAKISERFPTADRVPDALYRTGLIELGRGDPESARRYFERVANTYPDSDAAATARERLAEIG